MQFFTQVTSFRPKNVLQHTFHALNLYVDGIYEQYDEFLLKYACGSPEDSYYTTENGCQPLYRDGVGSERANGEICFCEGDFCVHPREDGKYLARFRERRGPVYVGQP